MLKRLFVFFLCFVFSAAVLWGGMFGVDYYRCTQMEKPVFARGIPESLYDDGGSGTYQGLGYAVEIEGHLSAEYGFQIESVEMSVLGVPCYSAIACY